MHGHSFFFVRHGSRAVFFVLRSSQVFFCFSCDGIIITIIIESGGVVGRWWTRALIFVVRTVVLSCFCRCLLSIDIVFGKKERTMYFFCRVVRYFAAA